MTVIRRNRASLGLAVVVCQIVLQVLVPAALCCERRESGRRVAAEDCCGAAHPGQLCPMHASKRARAEQSRDAKCHARPVSDLDNLLVTLLTGDIVPLQASFTIPPGSDAAPLSSSLFVPLVSVIPPGPPPRA